jgi:hypothetical protein
MIATLGAAAFAVQERMAWRDSRGGIERRRRRHLDARRRRACGGLSERSWPCGCGCWALGPGCWKTVGLDRPVAACNTSAGHSAIHGHDHGVNMFRPGSIPRERLRSRFLGHRGGAAERGRPGGARRRWRPRSPSRPVPRSSHRGRTTVELRVCLLLGRGPPRVRVRAPVLSAGQGPRWLGTAPLPSAFGRRRCACHPADARRKRSREGKLERSLAVSF